jgi:hypothetical protein
MDTAFELSLRESWHLDNGPGTKSVRVLRYAVEGMPTEEEAKIGELPQRGQWSILRTRRGVVGKWSARTFGTPGEALSALRLELQAEK